MKNIGERKSFDKVLDLLRHSTGVDFAQYKEPTLRRRINRRIAAGKFDSLDDYARHLRSDPTEVNALYNDILIPVTSFFRDPIVYSWLRKNYLPQLAAQPESEGPIRIWVPGCSTGEEVYSLAIALTELCRGKDRHRPFLVFGTDINEAALAKARAGIYDDAIQKQVSLSRLERFFEPVSGGFRIHKNVRDACIFARHNLGADAPISNLDLISCRNVLIYLKPSLQHRIFPILHFGLKADGLLLLGGSETVGNDSELFAQKDKRVKAYSKKAAKPKVFQPDFFPLQQISEHKGEAGLKPHSPKNHQKHAELLAAVDSIILRNAGVLSEQARVVPLTIPQSLERVYIVFVDPEKKERIETGKLPTLTHPHEHGAAPPEVERLREELFTVRESMQAIIEQQGTTNEELRAANEEVVSSNEELQSTNEELETAKEELQSANEELTTLNNELENKNSQLEQGNLISSRFQAIVESSDDAIVAKDLSGIIQMWNKGAEKIFGYSAEEVIGRPITILIPPDQLDEEPAILAKVRSGERVDHFETIRKRKDGQLIDISLTISPVKNSAGQIIGASKIARDITDRKQVIRELRRAHDEIAKTSQAKDDFLAMLSHELRTPLNPVLLIASDAVADLDLSPGIRANFDLIRRSVEMESRLIDDLLDLTRIKSGKLKIERREINIHDALADAVSMVQSEIGQKKITLYRSMGNPHSIISGDKTRLQQIFGNVLKNAIKFSPAEGRITIHARATDGWYVVKITDTGIGMTPQELDQAFEPFKQGDHSTNIQRFGGLGLGLTITKKLVELHAGAIEAFSDGRDSGSTFTIKLPLFDRKSDSTGGDAATAHAGHHANRHLEILIVEDHETTRNTLARLLINRHHKVTMAASMAEALAIAEEKSFDLVISDIGLPDGNGCELFNQIRAKAPATKGIALSGYGMREDVERSKESGFFTHLVKPVDMRALDRALSTALSM